MRKLGICFGGNDAEHIENQLRIIKEAGFEAGFQGYHNREQATLCYELCRKIGLENDYTHAPFDGINNMWLPGEAGDNMLQRLLDTVDFCADYGITTTVVHLSSGWDAPAINDLGRSRYDKLVDRAVSKGVNIAFENLRKLANVAFAMEIYENVPNVGFCWDAGHELCYTPNVEFMPLFGDRLIAVHLHDNIQVRTGDLHMLPFDGKRDWQHAADLIKNSPYKGPVMLENSYDPRFYGDLTLEQFYARAYEAASKIRDLMGE